MNQYWPTVEHLAEFAAAIYRRDVPLQACLVFINNTPKPCSRHGQHKEICYSGNKQCHGIKYQEVTAPDGLFISLQGPFEGKRRDITLLLSCGLLAQLYQHLAGTNWLFMTMNE